MVYNLIQKKKYKVYVITLQTINESIAKRLLRNGVNVIQVDLRIGNIISGLLNLVYNLKRINPKQLHGWMYHGNVIAFFASLLYKKSLLIFNIRQALHSIKQEKFVTRVVILINAFISNRCKYVIYNSRVAVFHHERFGFDSNRSFYLPNGIDTKTFFPCVRKRIKFRNKLNIKSSTKVICMLARYDPIKGHEIFLKAALCLLKQENNVIFILAGNGLQILKSKYKKIIDNLGENLVILEHQNDVCTILNGVDILTVCSLSEGFPNVLGQAMAVGTVCISSNAGDAGYILGEESHIFYEYSPEALSNKWKFIFNKPENELIDISLYSRLRIKNYFSQENFFNNYNKVMNTL